MSPDKTGNKESDVVCPPNHAAADDRSKWATASRARRVVVVFALGWLALVVSAGSALAETPAAAAGRVAEQITTATSPTAAGSAAAMALRRGGVGILHKGRSRKPRGPDSGLRVLRAQTLIFAHQARPDAAGAQITVGRLGRILRDMRAPVRAGRAGIAAVLRNWVSGAAADPSDPHSFAPLFVAEIVKRRQPGVNLAADEWDPRDVRLSGLEIELFAAALTQGLPSASRSRRSARVGRRRARAAKTTTPCSDAIKAFDVAELGPFGSEITGLPSLGEEVKKYGGAQFRKALETAYGREISKQQYGRLMQALGVLAEIVNTQSLYQSLSVRVFPQDGALFHRPRQDQELRHFKVVVGIDEELWRAYHANLARAPKPLRDTLDVIRDCLRAGGIPKFEDLDELAGQVEKFVVRWHPLGAPSWLARINVGKSFGPDDFPGALRQRLRRINDHESGADLAIDVLPVRESDAIHASGCAVGVDVTATAEVNLSRPPKPSVFTNVLDPSGGGLAKLPKSVISLAIELYRGLDTPSATGTLSVFWHTSDAQPHARAAEQATSCRPALALDADITHEIPEPFPGAGGYHVRVHDLRLATDDAGVLNGTQPLEVVSYHQSASPPNPCVGFTGVASVNPTDPLRVTSLAVDPSSGRPLAIGFEPGSANFYTEVLGCYSEAPFPCCRHLIDMEGRPTLSWFSLWSRVLGDDGAHFGPPRGTIDGWEQVSAGDAPGPDGVIARKTIDIEDPGGGRLHADLTLKVATP
jgi:hypothetical protein